MYRLKPDSWRQGRLRSIDHKVFLGIALTAGTVRGLDYTTGDDVWDAKDFMLAAAPTWVWGSVGFLSGVLILASGVVSRRHLLVWLGHWWLATAYGLASLALVLSTVSDAWQFDGIRGGGSVTFLTAYHVIMGLRTGVHPLRTGVHPLRPVAPQVGELVITPGEADDGGEA